MLPLSQPSAGPRRSEHLVGRRPKLADGEHHQTPPRAKDVRPGTHISAIGSDAPHKQELDPAILSRASLVVADSRSQCRERGEVARALDAGAISPDQVSELGDVIAGRVSRRTSDDQITIFDSTGVAVQDIQIASAVARAVGVTVG